MGSDQQKAPLNFKKRILIADDDALVIDFISFKLRNRGYDVDSVDHGEDVIPQIEERTPHLLILDYQLGGVASGEIIATLRERPKAREMPIIVLSSAWREQDVLEALELGINDFMTKPFSPDELLMRVKLALQVRQKLEQCF